MMKFLSWILIALIIVVFLGIDFFYVGGLESNAHKDHVEVDTVVKDFERRFNNNSKTGLINTPSERDMQIGTEFMDGIVNERNRCAAVWMGYGAYFNTGIVNDEVIYPAGHSKAGEVVNEKIFADFLQKHYLKIMADAENALMSRQTPAWEQMWTQSMYATNFRWGKEEAVKKAASSAPGTAAAQSRIFKPSDFIPVKENENFEQKRNQSKRWQYWRCLLIFQDVLGRAVVNSVATVERDVVGFERAPADYSTFSPAPPMKIFKGKGERFIENISRIDIKPVSVGDAIIPGTLPVKDKTGDDKDPNASEGKVYFDVYSVEVELVAHIKVINALQKEIIKTDKVFYIPQGLSVLRFSDDKTMGNLVDPLSLSGELKVVADPQYASSEATPVRLKAAYQREPPVQAVLSYLVYRPRIGSGPNPEGKAEEAREEELK